MIALLLTLQLATQAPAATTDPTFTVQLIDGATIEGKITGWQADSIQLSADESSETIPLERVARVIRNSIGGQAELASPGVLIGLIDGSIFSAHGVLLGTESDRSTFKMIFRRSPITLSTEAVRFVRFRKPTPALAEQWQELCVSKHNGDAVVIRRNEKSLDYLEGIILGISPKIVDFEFDGEQIPVEIQRLEGAIFFHQKHLSKNKSPTMRFSFGPNDVIQASSARLEVDAAGGAVVEIETESGAILPIRIRDLERIDFTAGRVAYLSDLKPAVEKITPTVGSRVSADALSKLLYAPRRDESYAGTPLILSVPSEDLQPVYAKGLAVHSRTELTYRLRGEYQRLKAIVGLEPHRSQSGSVQLVIKTDGAIVYDQTIARGVDPVELDIDIAEANKLTILVDYGNDGDAGDRLHLCNLRVIK